MQELEAQKANREKRLAEVRSEIRNAGKRARRQQASTHLARVLYDAGIQEQCPQLEAKQQAEILMLLELANLCTDVVVSYALGQGKEDQHRSSGFDEWDPCVRQAISAAVDLLYLSVPFALVVGALDGTENHQKKLSRYVVEYQVFHWLVEQNCEKGVSPNPGLVYDAAGRFVPEEIPQQLRQGMKGFFLSGSRAARYWLVSFKMRWDVKIGGLGSGEDLEPGLLEQKVPWPLQWLVALCGVRVPSWKSYFEGRQFLFRVVVCSIFGPIFGVRRCTQNWGPGRHNTRRFKRRAPSEVPFWGTIFWGPFWGPIPAPFLCLELLF